jgi:hypothetical protein
MKNFDAVWSRIEANAGETFHQLRGAEFRYAIQGNSVVPDRTNRSIARSQFEKALEIVPLDDTTSIQHLQGPSYIYAILMDKRIRQSEW